jgi:hypothetical protein
MIFLNPIHLRKQQALAFGTIFAEAQRRYFESVAPYARRLIDQVGVPDENNKCISWDRNIYILKVMLTCTSNFNTIIR